MRHKALFFVSLLICTIGFTSIAYGADLTKRLSGRILLQVESKGEAWYVYPKNQTRYYLGRPADAFDVMRKLGVGISDSDFQKFNSSSAPSRLSGLILLNVEDHGKAYYVYPENLKLYYLGRPTDAFNIMRGLGLGIANDNLNQIKLAIDSKIPLTETNLFLVTRIIDGDTIELESGEKVRYIGMDTPERGEFYFKEATDTNSDLVLNKQVRLEKDVSETDRYGRLLRYVYVDDIFVNYYLVTNGYAYAYNYPPDSKYAQKFSVAQDEADKLNKGMWFYLNSENTDDSSTTSTEVEVDLPASSHTWYTSSYYTAQYYYCDTDPAWKNLSSSYLQSYSSQSELLSDFPDRILHAPCN